MCKMFAMQNAILTESFDSDEEAVTTQNVYPVGLMVIFQILIKITTTNLEATSTSLNLYM